MKIAVIGTGYVGLVTGTCFAETGNTVTCVDIDEEKIDRLKAGKVTIYEPGLEVLFERNVKQGRLAFTTNLSEGIYEANVIFLALPTPPSEDGSADLKYVLDVAEKLGYLLKDYAVIIDKSTVPVGTTALVAKKIRLNANVDFDVVSNPEFLREGAAIEDFMKPERVIIGTQSGKAKKIMGELYAPFVRQGNPIIFMDERSAELTKYAANSFLATKITFMNEIANLCERLGADVDSVRKGMGTDSRIGNRFLFPGIGYGGSCFPKDVQALSRSAIDSGYDFKILNATMKVNQDQKLKLMPAIRKHFNGSLKGKTIAFWGLSFKPQTDDVREAPSIENIRALLSEGVNINAHDPEAMTNTKNMFNGELNYYETPYDAAVDADAVFIATEWQEFRTPDFEKLSKNLKSKVIFDGRNLYSLSSMKDLGYTYYSIGRETIYG